MLLWWHYHCSEFRLCQHFFYKCKSLFQKLNNLLSFEISHLSEPWHRMLTSPFTVLNKIYVLEGNVNKQKLSLSWFAASSISKLILFIEMKWHEFTVPNENLWNFVLGVKIVSICKSDLRISYKLLEVTHGEWNSSVSVGLFLCWNSCRIGHIQKTESWTCLSLFL